MVRNAARRTPGSGLGKVHGKQLTGDATVRRADGQFVTTSARGTMDKTARVNPSDVPSVDVTADKSGFTAEVVVQVQKRLDDLLANVYDLPAHFGTPEEATDRLLAALPLLDPYDKLIGPFYDRQVWPHCAASPARLSTGS